MKSSHPSPRESTPAVAVGQTPAYRVDEPYDHCWSEAERQAHAAEHTPTDIRIRSHWHGAAEVTKTILSLGTRNVFDRVFYHPNDKVYVVPTDVRARVEEVTFPSADGTVLSGWFLHANPDVGALGTVVHFHGCCNNLTHEVPLTEWLTDEGLNVFLFDYRGYGRSAGKPTRDGVHQDCLAAMRFVRSFATVNPQKLLVLGQSLGGATALSTVGEGDRRGICAVAVEGTFLCYREVVNSKMSGTRLTYPIARLMVSDAHSPTHSIARIAPIPLLVMHGSLDAVIPLAHGQRVFAAAGEPKTLQVIEGGLHLDALLPGRGAHRRMLSDFFRLAVTGG